MGFFNLFLKKYPIKVLIREIRGTDFRWAEDRAARVKRPDGIDTIEFKSGKRRKDTMAAPSYDMMSMDDRGGAVLELLNPKSGEYVPIKHDLSQGIDQLKLSSASVDEWYALENRMLAEITKPSQPWWERYVPLFASVVIIGLMVVGIIMMFNQMPAVMGQIQGHLNTVLEIQENQLLQSGIITGSGPGPGTAIG